MTDTAKGRTNVDDTRMRFLQQLRQQPAGKQHWRHCVDIHQAADGGFALIGIQITVENARQIDDDIDTTGLPANLFQPFTPFHCTDIGHRNLMLRPQLLLQLAQLCLYQTIEYQSGTCSRQQRA